MLVRETPGGARRPAATPATSSPKRDVVPRYALARIGVIGAAAGR